MALREVKHNRDEELNAQNLRAALRNRPVSHRFLLIRPYFSKRCFAPEASSGTASITATGGFGYHSSLAIKEIGITVSRFRLSGTDRRNNAVALIRQLTGSIQELRTSHAIFHCIFLRSLCRNRDVKTPSYPGINRFRPCKDLVEFLLVARAGHKAA
jgi:hypothetical protein